MGYLGGKVRIANQLVEVMKPHIDKATCYIEPFVGSCAVLIKVDHLDRRAADANVALINMYKALQRGWEPDWRLGRPRYDAAKHLPDTDPEKAFCGAGMSYGGCWFKSFGRLRRGDDRSSQAPVTRRSLLKKRENIQDVQFFAADYRELDYPSGCVVYCDPPYTGTTQLYSTKGVFDDYAFWEFFLSIGGSKGRVVFISEYDGGRPWWVKGEWASNVIRGGIATKTASCWNNGGAQPRIERLYRIG